MFQLSTLFSDIFTKVHTVFVDAEKVVENTYEKLVTVFPSVKPVVDAEVSALKQQVSNAFAFVDTELAPHYADAVSMVESAADTLVMGMTHGAAAPAVPVLNVGISSGFALLRGVLDHAEAQAKANLTLPPATGSDKPSVAAIVSAVTAAGSSAVPATPGVKVG